MAVAALQKNMAGSASRENLYQNRLEAIKDSARSSEEESASGENETPRVHPLDLDFILMLMFAGFFDVLDIILEVISIAGLTVPKPLTICIDALLAIIIGGWVYWRTKKMIDSKKQQIQSIQRAGAQMKSQLTKQMAKAATKPLRRTVLRTVIAFLGEVLDIVVLGIIPFWTITVVLTLREKGE